MRITHGLSPTTQSASAVTVGNFDGVHLGHQAMLKRMVAQAQILHLCPSVVTFDPHPREWFTPQNAPARLYSLRDKLACLAECGVKHVHVCPFNTQLSQMSAIDFVEQLLIQGMSMRYLIIGDDFRFGAQRAGDFNLLKKISSQHAYHLDNMPSQNVDGIRVSSTAIRQALSVADFKLAKQLLGRPYHLSGHVVQGDKNGHKLGFPTANLRLTTSNTALKGVFMVRVHGVSTQPWPAVANLGTRPTLHFGTQTRLETHLLNFTGNLYGRVIRVEFLDKLRDEQKFSDLTALSMQIAEDVRCAQHYFKISSEINA